MSLDTVKNLFNIHGNVDIGIINLLKSIVKATCYTDTLFVSSAGDNSDGSSWTKAYTSPISALDWIKDNQAVGETHLVMIGDGTFDMNTTGDPEYTSINVAIIGMGKNKTWLTNDHASATSILKFDSCGLTIANLTIHTGNNNITGLHLDCNVGSWLQDGTIIENVDFRVLTPTGAHTFLYIEGSVEKLHMSNCTFYGYITYTTAIYTDDATYCTYTNLQFHTCLIGIHLNDADDRYNVFKDIYFSYCDICIQIDNAGAGGNYFENIHFNYTYTTNISDAGATNYYYNLIKNGYSWEVQEEIYPNNLTVIPVIAGAGANSYGAANTEIKSVAATLNPYYVKGFTYEADTSEKWGVTFEVDLGIGAQTFSIVEGVANELKVYYFNKPFIVRQGVALECAVKSETGGNTMSIWLIIEEI